MKGCPCKPPSLETCVMYCVTTNKELPFCVEHCATVLTERSNTPSTWWPENQCHVLTVIYIYIYIMIVVICINYVYFQLCLSSTLFIFNYVYLQPHFGMMMNDPQWLMFWFGSKSLPGNPTLSSGNQHAVSQWCILLQTPFERDHWVNWLW